MRTIAVVTVARSDYGLYRPILRLMRNNPELRLHLIVSGGHLAPEYSGTVQEIEADGFPIADHVEMLLASDHPEAVPISMAVGMIGFAHAYAHARPDLIVLLGDRFEMCSAALAALPLRLPVAHIHGGELTQGAIDDALRHNITTLSHLHFVATETYARRVRQLGEESWRVIVSGSPAVDNLNTVRPLDRQELEERYGIRVDPPPLLVTNHPVTLEYEQTDRQVDELLAALSLLTIPVVFTGPNADPGGRRIRQRLLEFTAAHTWARFVENLGSAGYVATMKAAAAMVGNSSSGLIEAPTLRLPVVNIGTRQNGRVRARNVLDVGYERTAIAAAIRTAISSEFRRGLAGLENPYGDGRAAERIVHALIEAPLERLIPKRFIDLAGVDGPA